MAKTTKKAETRAVRVLVVDDSSAVRELVVNVLRKRGWLAEGAADGLQALARLQHGAFDVVITDLQIPCLDGLALLREIHRMEHPLPVVVQTSVLDTSQVKQIRRAGAFRVLWKGGSLEDLIRSVEEACQASANPAARCA